ncbi:MAG: hypothetical protein ABIQ51_01915 [Mesorhizobium sp.]
MLPGDRADETLKSPKPVVRHVIERDDGRQSPARLRVTKKRHLRAARLSTRVEADLVALAFGKRNDGGPVLSGAQAGGNLNEVDDARV